MSRQNWDWSNLSGPLSHTASRVRVGVGLAVMILAACTPLATPFPAPTATPIVVLSPTPSPLPSTAVLPTLAPDVPLLPSEIALDPALAARLRSDLASVTNVSEANIRLAQVDAGRWLTEHLGCTNTPSEVVATGMSIRLLAGHSLYTYHVSGDQMQRCDGSEVVHGELLMQIDPVALEMVLLAQQHVAQTLDLPTRRIRLVDIMAVIWPDTSLGCPLPDQTYAPTVIDGYRVVVAAGDETFAFHTDSERVVPCEAGREALPS